MDETLDQKSKL
jgi:hypothetical protein